MKKFVVVFGLFTLCLGSTLTCGCALYFSEGQYEKGISLTPATSHEWARQKQDKLALEKVQAMPAHTAAVNDLYPQAASGQNENIRNPATAGLKGYIKNASTNLSYNIKVYGPENKAWFVPPGVQVEDYLIPGDYVSRIFYGGEQVGKPWFFKVNGDLKYFEGRRDAHWYLVAQW
ncbi:MAG: hypothetical protein MUC28_03445 [Planctomycetes bacterium]|jgi:hypothetical protein|nr:hypothetical protein [Planctomycetota bacterium]